MSVEFQSIDEFKKFLLDENVLDKFKLDKLGVFGSFARAEAANDIDILVSKLPLRTALELKIFLEKKSKTNFDVVVEEYANPILLFRAKKDIVYVP